MKRLIVIAVAMVAPGLVWPQTSQPAATGTKVAATATVAPKPRTGVRRSALKAVEEITPVDDDVSVNLTEEELELAKRVHVGLIHCELGSSVTITASEKRPGFFSVKTRTASFRMHPVTSRTGAIRLEDPRAGAMWLQLGNKSMLMSQKLGQRLADDCISPDQAVVAEMLKKNPLPSILDAPVAKTSK
ncbi:MAG: hypothetical protein ACOYNZ_01920 [Rhodoferax sp.]